jgi:hypothetical protein
MNTRPLMLAIAATFALASANAFADEPPTARKSSVAEPAKPAAKAQTHCSGSGSHIRRKAPNCASSAPMRSYSQQDLETTGDTDLGQALKKLDPIFR